jgi:glutathione peroxidase
MSTAILDIPVSRMEGSETTLRAYQGKVLLVVNVASKCGFTPQYEGLERIHRRFTDRGFLVLGFPANDFAAQEPGSNEEILTFCRSNFGVEFPMFQKISVAGEGKHPLYKALIRAQPKAVGNSDELRQHLTEFGVTPNADPEVLWNFEKFLINRKGEVVARFPPETDPEDPALLNAIEKELAS